MQIARRENNERKEPEAAAGTKKKKKGKTRVSIPEMEGAIKPGTFRDKSP